MIISDEEVFLTQNPNACYYFRSPAIFCPLSNLSKIPDVRTRTLILRNICESLFLILKITFHANILFQCPGGIHPGEFPGKNPTYENRSSLKKV